MMLDLLRVLPRQLHSPSGHEAWTGRYKAGHSLLCHRFYLPVGILVCICIIVLNAVSMRHLFLSSSSARLHALAVLSLAARTTFAVDPTVELGYTSYSGTSLSNGVTQWLGMRYAAPPLDDLRFRAPVDPTSEDGPVEADTPGPICLGTGSGPPSDDMDEDCLFINVFAPSNASSDSGLPVYFFIQGGGFNTNSNPNYNGSGLIMAGDMDLVVVNFNYRVGPYGECPQLATLSEIGICDH